jgi:hypothetical protein
MDGLVKRGVTLAVMRVSLICWIVLILQQPFHILAGHDLMVHLAIYNDGPFETEQVPAVFGVPQPSSTSNPTRIGRPFI